MSITNVSLQCVCVYGCSSFPFCSHGCCRRWCDADAAVPLSAPVERLTRIQYYHSHTTVFSHSLHFSPARRQHCTAKWALQCRNIALCENRTGFPFSMCIWVSVSLGVCMSVSVCASHFVSSPRLTSRARARGISCVVMQQTKKERKRKRENEGRDGERRRDTIEEKRKDARSDQCPVGHMTKYHFITVTSRSLSFSLSRFAFAALAAVSKVSLKSCDCIDQCQVCATCV